MRILWVGESSYLSSGFSVYSREVLGRLQATGKYELFELGSFGTWKDSYEDLVPWNFMPAVPNPNDEVQVREYNSSETNKFGEWKFEKACLWAKPDIVCDIRDWWYMEFEGLSPFRQFYRWVIMPTVDAVPQNKKWIASFLTADRVLTYTDWASGVLADQTGGSIQARSASPAADPKVFQPKPNKKEHRRKIGVDPEALIIGTVMRNQKRKLYPDLIESFASLLHEGPQHVAERAFLYLHTSYPDLGWDIPELVTQAGIGRRTIMTYVCRSCRAVFPAFFSDARTICRRCGSPTATLPNSSENGVSREALNEIYNIFDVYVQYANSEGYGIPMVEASYVGLPVMAVDYSAMSDVVRKVGGYPIPVLGYHKEHETGCLRAVPDNNAFVRTLVDFFEKPESVRLNEGLRARELAEKEYTYDKAARAWEESFDSVLPPALPWSLPLSLRKPNRSIPENLPDDQFVRWVLTNIGCRPDFANSYLADTMIRDLTWGTTNREAIINLCNGIRNKYNFWERKRAESNG